MDGYQIAGTGNHRANSRGIDRRWIIVVLAVVAGLVAAGGMVWHASYSAFTSKTSNPTSNWNTGTVALTDDDSNVALFTVSNMKPGATGVRCIQVTSTGTLPSTVKLYTTASSYSQTNAVGDNVTLLVTQGTESSAAADCSTFTPLGSPNVISPAVSLTSVSTTYTNFSNGAGNWAPTGSGSETRAYKFSYTFNSSAPDTTQNGNAQIGFTWEAQNS